MFEDYEIGRDHWPPLEQGGRRANFGAGVNHAKTDANRPAPVERRAGPLGPRTQREQEDWDDEIAWSRGDRD